ncbi:hypothetical protein, partial [Vibrio lentus]|uniref:hypothetical protein n=1 Tax=Vibrio lentus TaxID=136468 RepID=UPI001F539B3D
ADPFSAQFQVDFPAFGFQYFQCRLLIADLYLVLGDDYSLPPNHARTSDQNKHYAQHYPKPTFQN